MVHFFVGISDEEFIKTDLNPQYDYSASFQDANVFKSCGGGYTYAAGDTDERTRNRVIYWRCTGNVLEIHEISLDLELRGNGTKYSFEAAIVPNSVCFQEEDVTSGGSNRCICINLVLADGTLYRRGFRHPQVLDHARNGMLESVLMHPHMSWSMATETVPSAVTGACDTFVIACSDGNVSAYVLPSLAANGGSASDHEWILLKSVNVVSRLLTGLTPQFLRSGGHANQIVASGSAQCKRSQRMLACTLTASLDFEAYVVNRGSPVQLNLCMRSCTFCRNNILHFVIFASMQPFVLCVESGYLFLHIDLCRKKDDTCNASWVVGYTFGSQINCLKQLHTL